MIQKFLIAFAALFFATSSPAAELALTLTTPRGKILPLNLHSPAGVSKTPVLIIAPGGNYHKEMPLFTEIAARAVTSGIAVIRFDWGYCKFDPVARKCTGRWSSTLSDEEEDLQTVVKYAQSHPNLDATKIIVAGKSLGSLVNYPIFKQDLSLKALFLLTPLCTETEANGSNPRLVGEQNYPGLTTLTRPILFLLGNADPACSVPMLYDFSRNTKGNTSIVVVGGDHSLKFGRDEDGFVARNTANIASAASIIVHWANVILDQ
jgi:predicted alpha/beta-hydrolase family hydrolase